MTDIDFERLYVPEDSDDESDALDYLYQTMSGLLGEGAYERVGAVLRDVDFRRLSMTMSLGFLTITLAYASVVPGRDEFYDRVHERCVRDGEDPQSLLHGLDRRGGSSAAWGHNLLHRMIGLPDPKAPG